MHRFAYLFPILAVASIACSPPQPPTLTPKKASVTSVSLSGIDLNLDLDATNPNGFDVAVQSIDASVTLDGNPMGTTKVSEAIDLPSKATTPVTVPLSIPWSNMGPLAGLATSGKDVTYEVQGTAAIGSAKLNVTVPFAAKGTIPHDQLVKATMRSLPTIPGLTAPAR